MVVSHTKHSGGDDGTFFYFPQSTFVAMGGSENVANGTSFEITQKDMKSSRCWEGNVTLFDTGDRNDGAEVFGRRQTDYKAGQWAARDMLQLKECGSKCSQASSGKFDIHCVSFICMTTVRNEYGHTLTQVMKQFFSEKNVAMTTSLTLLGVLLQTVV